MLKRGPTHLARLRHPKILTIDHPVEESRYMYNTICVFYKLFYLVIVLHSQLNPSLQVWLMFLVIMTTYQHLCP